MAFIEVSMFGLRIRVEGRFFGFGLIVFFTVFYCGFGSDFFGCYYRNFSFVLFVGVILR